VDPFDPSGSGQTLALILTAAGVPVAGAIIAAITQALKAVPLVAQHPVATTAVISALLIGYAAVALAVPIDMISVFGLLLSWLAINGFSKATYDTAHEYATPGDQ